MEPIFNIPGWHCPLQRLCRALRIATWPLALGGWTWCALHHHLHHVRRNAWRISRRPIAYAVTQTSQQGFTRRAPGLPGF